MALVLGLAACGGPQKPVAPPMARFNAALCPKPPAEDTSLPLDPNLEGVKADLLVGSRTIRSVGEQRLTLTFRNVGLRGFSLSLPRQAFSLAGFDLVDHDCVPVPYVVSPVAGEPPTGAPARCRWRTASRPPSTRASTISAPGLTLRPGIYAIRLSLRMPPAGASLRGRTIQSDWALFAVMPPKSR